jgi:deazaflavin-dependent oxidoreductase (nitroreductase family)
MIRASQRGEVVAAFPGDGERGGVLDGRASPARSFTGVDRLSARSVGRRTGKICRTVLEVLEYRPELSEAIVLSAWGPNSGWLLNLRTQGPLEIIIGSQRFAGAYRFLGRDEAAAALLGYQRRNRWIAPPIRFGLGRFAG